MPLCFLLALAASVALGAGPAAAQPTEPVKVADGKPGQSTEAILKTLHSAEVKFDGNLNEVPLVEMLTRFAKVYGIPFVIMEEQFKLAGVPDIRFRKASLAMATAKGMTLHRFLTIWLASMNAMYLVRGDYIEIVPMQDGKPEAASLVSLVVKEKPFNEVVEKLADEYDLSVVIAPQSGDGRTGFVSARLKNVPPAVALEMLAVQCNLRVIRKGSAFLITSRDHADELFNEKMERERQQIELQKLRATPAPKPDPAPVPPKVLNVVPTFDLKADRLPIPLQLQKGELKIAPKVVPPPKPPL